MTLLSGATALMYEMVWFRSLSLVFGSTHQALAATVAVFMLGLAVGSRTAGKALRRIGNPLLLYGLLETGIALFAAIFLLLIRVYPGLYAAIAGVAPEAPVLPTLLRLVFSLAAMLVPTALMGATLPVLTSLTTRGSAMLGRQLSFLYGLNTFGAVIGAALTGYYLLGTVPVSRIGLLAMAVNLGIGVTCILWSRSSAGGTPVDQEADAEATRSGRSDADLPAPRGFDVSRLIVWGIGLSGFCALGYEVLWTRVLILFLDGSTYSATTVLVSFLLGISLGGAAYGLFTRRPRAEDHGRGTEGALLGFGIVQVLTGVVTVIAMSALTRLPGRTVTLMRLFGSLTSDDFLVRQLSNLTLSVGMLASQAFLMGLAVPLAARIHSRFRREPGEAVGSLIAGNTVGAVLGAITSGFALIPLFGIERSLLLLAVANLGMGVFFVVNRRGLRKAAAGAVAAVTAVTMLVLALSGDRLLLWDKRFLATYTANRAPSYVHAAALRAELDGVELLHYGEGGEAIVSSVRDRSGVLVFTINGRVEASTQADDVQNQLMLGHLPMLLHRNPRTALVVGLGSGMTLGAVAAHPTLESVTLAEVEPQVFGVARTFRAWNHGVLDNPKLRVALNDGRNHLLASRQKFDVITADPIHPSWRGAGYLYSEEYFRLAADHLSPGGLICQWLPLYQLSPDDLRTVVATVRRHFAYVSIWLTLTDAQIVAGNEPLALDQDELQRRMDAPVVSDDLRAAGMWPSDALLTYFVAGPPAVTAYVAGATVNTDDNVYLEFSSPRRITDNSAMAANVRSLNLVRESVAAYLLPLGDADRNASRLQWWRSVQNGQAAADLANRWYLGEELSPAGKSQVHGALNALPDIGRWGLLRKSLP